MIDLPDSTQDIETGIMEDLAQALQTILATHRGVEYIVDAQSRPRPIICHGTIEGVVHDFEIVVHEED